MESVVLAGGFLAIAVLCFFIMKKIDSFISCVQEDNEKADVTD